MDCALLRPHICILLIALVSFGVSVVKSDSTNDGLRDYLKRINVNRHHVKNPDGKTHARDFIRDTFMSFGLHTWMEPFVPKPPNTEVAKGVNVVGMLPGKLAKTREDRLILIGSHYDTTRNTSQGADDNGSGVVALLQAAKLLTTKSDKCTREYSVMFVAFDFEEWEDSTLPGCACAELGCGSRAFVANFSHYYNLFPNMSVARYGQLQGAIIMDTMMNYNSTPYSQEVPPGLETFFPGQYNAIANNSCRGDFLVNVGRYADDDQLLNTFSYYFKKDKSKYKLQVFRLPFHGQPSTLSGGQNILSDFLRSDHINFWNEVTSNRAIFLSDTADLRSYMKNCYHKNCDSLSHVTDEFLGFLSKSCDTIAMTTDDLTKAKCKTNPPNEESSELPTGGIMIIGMLLGSIPATLATYCCCVRKKKPKDELVTNEEQNWSATNPVYEARESEGIGNRGTGNTETGNPGNGSTGTRNTATGNPGTGSPMTGSTATRSTEPGSSLTRSTTTSNERARSTRPGNTGVESLGTGNPATGNSGMGSTGTGNTETGNRGTGNKRFKNEVRKPRESAEPNIYEAVEPGPRLKENEVPDRRSALREPGKDVHESIA